jgi:thiamine kinase-like enzyme
LLPSSLSADVPKVEVLERELAWLKEHLSQLESPVVFCHNDLLCKNIIYDSTKGTAPLLQLASSRPQLGWSAGFNGLFFRLAFG